MLEAISSYDTEPITDRRNHAYGMPITITSVTSPIAMAIDGTIEKIAVDFIISLIFSPEIPIPFAFLMQIMR